MSSISPDLEKKICRLARREIKAQAAPTRQAIIQYRREVAELKRQVREQEQILISLQLLNGYSRGSQAANADISEHERWLLSRPKVLKGVLEGLRQADNGEWDESPFDFEADMEKARKALEKFNRKKSKG
jgi:hypothetical protein